MIRKLSRPARPAWEPEPEPNLEFTFKITGIAFPTQAEGVFKEYPYYYRARHGTWSLSVALREQDANDILKYTAIASGIDPTNGVENQLEVLRKVVTELTIWWWRGKGS
jgi:hypothetical protein